MKQTWRWFGPADLTSKSDMKMAGVEAVVSALHHIPNGEIWSQDEIALRHQQITKFKNGDDTGLTWDVVESVPVSEDIKKQNNHWREHIEAYKTSLENIAASGIQTVCYNFMPVLDWTRTDLVMPLNNGGTCMHFDYIDFVVYDIFIIARTNAQQDFPEQIIDQAAKRFATMSDETIQLLTRNITFGLPGANDTLSLDDVRAHLEEYKNIDADRLRANFIDFLEQIIPTAEKLGLRMCCHPDDPPFGLLGLPRIMSTEQDYKHIVDAVPSPANGITLCSGSLGARADNDLPGMMQRLGEHVHFLHLRNVKRTEPRDPDGIRGSFYEAEHLGGDTDIVSLIAAILQQETKRKKSGRADWNIPFRPDHGQDLMTDLNRRGQPGYPTIGRMRGLAELRGVIRALSHSEHGVS
ncbi:MAG: mannonate dehydratase [Rhizobiales bacterium]|nr:mannonate dehydratase [Hyphomicrobiales bacterium]NRB13753.1 mannonate dehydratase [Hyphomicrobiales bacterium]